MTMGQGSSKDNIQSFGEVFTPAFLIFEMLLTPDMRDCVKNLEQKMCDPCVGQGQFPACELIWKLFYNIENLNETNALAALESLIGADVQAESIAECKAHMLATILQAYKFLTGQELSAVAAAKEIIDRRYFVGDTEPKDEPKRPRRKNPNQLTLF